MDTTNKHKKNPRNHQRENTKHTLMNQVLSLVVVLVFMRYVAGTYAIPTGSMAPTLRGSHVPVRSEQTGAAWAANPRDSVRTRSELGRQELRYLNRQAPRARNARPLRARDHYADTATPARGEHDVPLRGGDRIVVQHYLGAILPPTRWDAAVFRNPEEPRMNYIKRLVGMPNEDVLLVDGDVFARPLGENAFLIQRKPDQLQHTLWQTIFSTELTPLRHEQPLSDWNPRWRPAHNTPEWERDGGALRWDSANPAELVWDNNARPIDDWEPYNEFYEQTLLAMKNPKVPRFAVADLRVRAVVEPEAKGLGLEASILAHGTIVRATLHNGTATLQMRKEHAQTAWDTLARTKDAPDLKAGTHTPVAVCHVDQELQLWVDGLCVLRAPYDWNARQRLRTTVGETNPNADAQWHNNAEQPRVRWRIWGAPVTMRRVGLDRDLYFRPTPEGRAAAPHRAVALGHGEYFMLGDNSAFSGDSRMWNTVAADVAAIEPGLEPGVVPQRLMIGRAAYVFFPSPMWGRARIPILNLPVPVPDIGQLRRIR